MTIKDGVTLPLITTNPMGFAWGKPTTTSATIKIHMRPVARHLLSLKKMRNIDPLTNPVPIAINDRKRQGNCSICRKDRRSQINTEVPIVKKTSQYTKAHEERH